MRDFNSHTTLPASAKGKTLTLNPSPRTGEGSDALTPGPSPRTGEGRRPSPSVPLPGRFKGGQMEWLNVSI